MKSISNRLAWMELDLSNLRYNIRSIQDRLNVSIEAPQIMGIVKADAYGHGAVAVAHILRQEGVRDFAVATLDEAIELRNAGFTETITILGICPSACADAFVTYGLSPVITSLESAKLFSNAVKRQKKLAENFGITTVNELSCFIVIDTGMGRIGFVPEDENTLSDIEEICNMEGLKVRGLLSHFASSDEEDKTFLHEQLAIFNKLTATLKANGYTFEETSLANSAAIMESPESWGNLVRPGIILYGEYPSKEVDRTQLDLKPVMSIKACITRIRKVPDGFTVSYGRHYTAKGERIIATIPVGYADGYPRALSSKGKVLINGQFAPIAGSVCMDQFMVDVTDIPDVSVGDVVTLMGPGITAEDLADACGTINYEILCSFGSRLAKMYRK